MQAYQGLGAMKEKTEALSNRAVNRVADLSQTWEVLMKTSISLRDIALSANEEERQKLIEARGSLINSLLAKLNKIRQDPTAGQEAVFLRLDDHIKEIGASLVVFDKLWVNSFEGPISLEVQRPMVFTILEGIVPIRNKIGNSVQELMDLEVKHQTELSNIADQTYKDTLSRVLTVSILSVVFALLASLGTVVLMRGITEKLSRAARSLKKSYELMDSTAHSVELSSTQLASSTTEEASSIAQTAAAMEEITATIAKTVQNVSTTLDVAEEGQQEANRGRDVVGKMLLAMNEIQSSNAKLEKMIKLIEEIKDKTRVINDIVFETRLLSFNASIEAARAGSQGRGFAVVAEEVGNLAIVSGKAADEIRVLLESSTSEVNEIVRGTQERINQGRSRAEECQNAFSSMGESLSRVCQYVRGISSAAQEQESGVKQINRTIGQLDTVTQSNASEAEGLNFQASDLSREALRMGKSVTQLNQTVFGIHLDEHDSEQDKSSSDQSERSNNEAASAAHERERGKVSKRVQTRGRVANRPQVYRKSQTTQDPSSRHDNVHDQHEDQLAESDGVSDRNDPRWKVA